MPNPATPCCCCCCCRGDLGPKGVPPGITGCWCCCRRGGRVKGLSRWLPPATTSGLLVGATGCCQPWSKSPCCCLAGTDDALWGRGGGLPPPAPAPTAAAAAGGLVGEPRPLPVPWKGTPGTGRGGGPPPGSPAHTGPITDPLPAPGEGRIGGLGGMLAVGHPRSAGGVAVMKGLTGPPLLVLGSCCCSGGTTTVKPRPPPPSPAAAAAAAGPQAATAVAMLLLACSWLPPELPLPLLKGRLALEDCPATRRASGSG